MVRPKKPAIDWPVTSRRYVRLRLEAQMVELMARHVAGGTLEQLKHWFKRQEQLDVTDDEMRQFLTRAEGLVDGGFQS